MIKTPFQAFADRDESGKAAGADKKAGSKVSIHGGPRSESRPSDDVKSEHHVKAHYDGSYTVSDANGDHYMPNHADMIEHMSQALAPESDEGAGPENASDKQSTRAGSGSKTSVHNKISGDIAR